jgi:ArsR family transcriptional regulator
MDECVLVADIFKALANPTRLRILKILCSKNRNVIEIAEELGLTQSSVSQHLKILENAGVIKKNKNANIVNCEIKHDAITKLLEDAKSIINIELSEASKMINNS